MQKNAGTLISLECRTPEASDLMIGMLFEYIVSGRPVCGLGVIRSMRMNGCQKTPVRVRFLALKGTEGLPVL